MGIKGEHDGLPINISSLLLQLLKDPLVPQMHSVEVSKGEHGVSEFPPDSFDANNNVHGTPAPDPEMGIQSILLDFS